MSGGQERSSKGIQELAGVTVGFRAQVLGRNDFPEHQSQVRLHSVAVMERSRARCGVAMFER